MSDKVLHDLMLEIKPESANHNEDKCPICSEKARASQEEKLSDAIFSQEQHEKLVAAAVEKATEEFRKESDEEVLRLNEQLKQAEESATAKDEKISELEAQIAAREEQDRLEELADERAEQVKAVATFSDEQIEARKMSWAKKDEEEFNALLEDYKEIAKASSGSEEGEEPPTSDTFDGTRETAGEQNEGTALASFFETGLAAVENL